MTTIAWLTNRRASRGAVAAGAVVCFVSSAATVLFAGGPTELPTPPDDNDYRPVSLAEAALGQLLFYDPILSGNKEVACVTCHHPAFGTSDGLSLSLGDGGIGLGPTRIADPDNPPEQRVPRNAQALFNLGAHEFTVLFHDGRIEEDTARPSGIRTPLDDDMVKGFASLLSAQTMFPVLSADEMAGHYAENEISAAVRKGELTGEGGAWDILARRVANIPAYATSFQDVYPHIDRPDDIAFTDISNAIAAFVEFEWRSDTSPFDDWLRGGQPLPYDARDGALLFYGDAGCSSCHAGAFQTDHDFHATGQIQIGPGKARRFESHARDVGRFGVTGRQEDLYAFRTPSLRNVALTAPYGHAGAYADLRAFLEAHVSAAPAFETYDRAQAVLPELGVDDWRILEDASERAAIVTARAQMSAALAPGEIDRLIAFLHSLTDPIATSGRLGIPQGVPSGLPVPTVAVTKP
ncbi:MAG: cytochrome-c peroxidase [Rhodobacteraceae bacterium]|nr:cytochrome-c peroxidase [Paracoccaceae bacterium]